MPNLQTNVANTNSLHSSSLLPGPNESLINSQRQFIMNVSLVSCGILVLAVILSVVKFISSADTASLWTCLILIAIIVMYGSAWLLARKGRVKLGGGVLLLSMLTVSSESIVFGNLSVISLLAFLSVSMGGLIILGTKAAYILTAWGSGMLILAVLTGRFRAFTSNANDPANPGTTDLVFLIIVMFIVIWLASYLAKSFNHANARLTRQASKLQIALADIEEKRMLGEDVSRQVFSLTAELNAIANQQASGSQQQATALTQVTVFLQEMTVTAQNIANNTNLLSQAAHQIKEVSHRVKTTTKEVSRVGESGLIAVEETIKGNQKVNSLYAELQRIVSELGQQQTQIKEVTTTIRSISDETHLLSLNAAIEAAGAGEYGERFAVVAGEVKVLADRSVRASQQINEILDQVAQGIQNAATTAASGHQEIQSALTTAQQSSLVLHELMGAIHQTGSEIEQIGTATVVMSVQSEEISLATNQQYGASTQALETLQSIGTIASQNASGSVEVTRTTHKLENLSHNLLKTLAPDKISSNLAAS